MQLTVSGVLFLSKSLSVTPLLHIQIIVERAFGKRINGLFDEPFGIAALMHTGTGRPGVAGQVVSSKHHINYREDGSEVFAVVLRVFAVVPVVVLWGGKNILQRAKIDPGISMYQHGMYSNENNIRIENSGRKTQHIQRYKRHGTGKENVDEMRTATRQPIHVLRGVVHGMKPPQIHMRMKNAVCPVLE